MSPLSYWANSAPKQKRIASGTAKAESLHHLMDNLFSDIICTSFRVIHTFSILGLLHTWCHVFDWIDHTPELAWGKSSPCVPKGLNAIKYPQGSTQVAYPSSFRTVEGRDLGCWGVGALATWHVALHMCPWWTLITIWSDHGSWWSGSTLDIIMTQLGLVGFLKSKKSKFN